MSDRAPVAVVVPVHGRLDLAERCVRAVDATTDPAVPLVVVDDHGAERVDDTLLASWARSPREVRLVRNDRNLGFPRTVNRALAEVPGHHVALVNSDVVVADGWLEELRAVLGDVPAGERVASATALANEASIASVPLPPHAGGPGSVEAAAEQAARRLRAAPSDLPRSVHLPVAIGHCVLLHADALGALGGFDEVFSPGYGEEVDWSMRAVRAGWTHRLALRCYVLHDGGGSFGRSRSRTWLRRRHEARLLARYPLQFVRLRLQARRPGPLREAVSAAAALVAGAPSDR